MPELKKFPVFGDGGRIGSLMAPARFLDTRSEKTIQLDGGGEITVPSDALEVQPDGSFLLRGPVATVTDVEPAQNGTGNAVPQAEPKLTGDKLAGETLVGDKLPGDKPTGDKLFREGYSIERVKVDRLVTETPAQRQEGDTLILPVVEEVLVVEKRLMLREEIRITRRRDEVEEVRTVDPSLHS